MFCTNCGTNVPEGTAFCTNCGQRMAPASSVAKSAQYEPVAPVQPTPVAPVQPTPVAPVQPTPVAPVQPTPVVPVQPTPVAPVQPTPVAPVQPTPVQPAPVAPVQPAPVAPVQPAPVVPVQPAPMAPVPPTPVVPVQPAPMAPVPPAPVAPVQPAPMAPVPPAPVAPVQQYAPQGAPQPIAPQMSAPSPAPSAPQASGSNGLGQGADEQPKKKKNLGLILGLAIGIPTLVIAIIVAVVFIVVIPKITGEQVTVSDNRDDDDKDPKPTDPDVDPDPVDPDPVDPEPVDPDPVFVENATRTIMIYIIGSNLESPEDWGAKGGAATADIYEMLAADIPDDVNVVLECGGAYDWEYPTVPDNSVSRHIIKNKTLEIVEDLGRTTMTEYGDLTSFIDFASENYPADNYSLVLWNHGGGIPISYGMDQLGDEMQMLTDVEIKQEILNSGIHFDTVIFDACNMCTLEIGMALKDCANYMVGAESYVNGIGIYYTNWLAETAGDVRDFSETIVEDYMDSLQDYGLVGSMSVIRLDRIEEVYTAYESYISSVNYNVYGSSYGDYNNYIKARGNCGEYYGTDSVDLTTLANKYETTKSSALINSVSNAVVYTRSDMPYGHGITAYSPYDYINYYNEGRGSMVTLNYSSVIVDFYDHLVSEMLSYYGADVVAMYGGDWFVDDYEVAAAGSSNEVGHLEVSNRGSYYGVGFDDASWDIIASIATAIVVKTDDGTDLVLGQDYQYTLDSGNYIALVDPEYWYWLNGDIATFYATSDYYDEYTGEWSRTGYIPVTVNGKTAALYIYFDKNNPSGLIQGYYYFNYQTLSRDDNTMYMITSEQEFDLYYPCLDEDGNPYYLNNGSPIYGDSLYIEEYYINLSQYSTYGYIEVVDVYGNKYQTDLYYFEDRKVVE